MIDSRNSLHKNKCLVTAVAIVLLLGLSWNGQATVQAFVPAATQSARLTMMPTKSLGKLPHPLISSIGTTSSATTTTSSSSSLQLAQRNDNASSNQQERGGDVNSGPVVNLSLVRQIVVNQVLIGFTIWTGGVGAQALSQRAEFGTDALLLGLAGVVPLVFFSRYIETSEAPAVANLNLSTNMLVLRLFGDKPQPVLALVVSAALAGLTGLVEETTFRGLVLPNLVQKFDGSVPIGLALSTLLFAVLHLNPLSVLSNLGNKDSLKESVADTGVLLAYQLVTGSAFGLTYLVTQNLAVPIVTHALFDFYVFYASHLMITTQMEYAREASVMPVAPRTVEAKWKQQRGDAFVLGAREAFFLADSNRDGVLSREELRIALYSYGMRLSADQSATVTAAADANQSGTIDFGEFLDFIGPTGSPGKAIKNSLLGMSG